MNIVMVTNTYKPHVGGVAVSVETFTREYRRRGHRVFVIAPEFENMAEEEEDVLRLPAIQHFNGSDFSVVYPIPVFLSGALREFKPDIVHSHHPFLLGDMALRIAAIYGIPVVYTHHTMYERYTHYVPGDSHAMQRFVIELATGYANLCNSVIAPSESIADILHQRGVTTPISVVPTGVDTRRYAVGNSRALRCKLGIPTDVLVVGHTGRLAPEKNLRFLAEAICRFCHSVPQAHFLVVGSGPSREEVEAVFAGQGMAGRLHFSGSLTGQELIDAYHAMDIFAFASLTETQGLVLVEAMAAGVPVVALDASGSREVVVDGCTGRLLTHESVAEFAAALCWVASFSGEEREAVGRAARQTAGQFSIPVCVERALKIYEQLVQDGSESREPDSGALSIVLRTIEEEWGLWANRAAALAEAALGSGEKEGAGR